MCARVRAVPCDTSEMGREDRQVGQLSNDDKTKGQISHETHEVFFFS